MNFTKDIVVINSDDENHLEIYKKELHCANKSRGECKYTDIGSFVNSDPDQTEIEDRALCFSCMKECFEKIKCSGCNKIIHDEDDEDEYSIEDCKCKFVKVKVIKEKPILECMWVRARDYK